MDTGSKKTPNARCLMCGVNFYIKPSLLKYGWGKYCSKKCKNESQRTGKYVTCAYCHGKLYRTPTDLQRKSKTRTYFCNKSCQCAWKNKQRIRKRKFKLLNKIWGSWCNSSIRTCGVLGTDANSVDPPLFFLRFLNRKPKRNLLVRKRPLRKAVLNNLYWKKGYSQVEISKFFGVTHSSVRRWLYYFKIPIKPRRLSCGRNPNSVRNLRLGQTPDAERKSAEARRVYTKEILIQKIKEFIERNGRIPTKNEFIHDSSCPDYVTYRDYFGTWNKAIEATGFEPNERWFCSRDLYAKDGHRCKSISEIIIDDWLFQNNIPHLREGIYPEGRYRCDFVIGESFIEFFGLTDALGVSQNYNEISKKKIEMCQKYNIPLITLYNEDLYSLDQTLGRKLNLKSYQKSLF